MPLTPEEMDRINGLVKEAIGFSASRGDTVNIINAPFQLEAEPAPLPETPLLDQPWLWDAVKQVAGLAVVLFLIFGVLRPVLKSLAEKGAMARSHRPRPEMAIEGPSPAMAALAGPTSSYDQTLETAKVVAQQEPQRVARVVREWVEKDG